MSGDGRVCGLTAVAAAPEGRGVDDIGVPNLPNVSQLPVAVALCCEGRRLTRLLCWLNHLAALSREVRIAKFPLPSFTNTCTLKNKVGIAAVQSIF